MSRDVCHDRFIYLEKRINELSDDLSELREAKAAPVCCMDTRSVCPVHGSGPVPTAPPFVLGSKTRNSLCAFLALNALDGTFHVARETARLIAEYVNNHPELSAFYLSQAIRDGEWGKE